MALRILVLGGGGREHALVWKLNQSSLVAHIFVCPGNGGTELSSKVSNVILPDPSFQNLSKWAVENDVSTSSSCIRSPDTALKDQPRHSRARATTGRRSRVLFSQRCLLLVLTIPTLHPFFRNLRRVYALVGIPVFGPTALAARMEGSKAFSKAFMTRHAIPTAAFRVFASSEVDKAVDYVRTCGHKVVLKASGLASGKGVLIPETTEDAITGLREIMVARAFGAAGASPLDYSPPHVA
jgi:phosphoribosylamine--glycine ligase / phosphoribosylformylglycinamidine cyclo-ligase